jgi:hypothetical protein
MAGLWVLILGVGAAVLPVALLYVWFRRRGASRLWFAVCLAGGGLSLGIAMGLQFFISFLAKYAGLFFSGENSFLGSSRNLIVFHIFLRIALSEETGRLIGLMLISRFVPGRLGIFPNTEDSREALGGAAGLVAGFGFGLIESGSYSPGNIGGALSRAFTATPLHGACGARVGMSLGLFKQKPVLGIYRFCSAVALHGMYDLAVGSSVIPRVFPILIALLSFISVLPKQVSRRIS